MKCSCALKGRTTSQRIAITKLEPLTSISLERLLSRTVIKWPSIQKPSRNDRRIPQFRKRVIALHVTAPRYGVVTPSVTNPTLGSGKHKVIEAKF